MKDAHSLEMLWMGPIVAALEAVVEVFRYPNAKMVVALLQLFTLYLCGQVTSLIGS
jgi:hypothetical protein